MELQRAGSCARRVEPWGSPEMLSLPLPEETESHGADEGGLERSRSSPLLEETEPREASGGGCERSRNSLLPEETEPYEASGGGHERPAACRRVTSICGVVGI